MKQKKHALVTGGAGFIGSHMVDRLLQEGYEITVLDNLSTGLRKNIPHNVTFVKGDTKNPKDVEKAFRRRIDVVFHIAGCASTINSFTNPLSDIEANFIGTVNIVSSCVKHNVTRLLYASSMTVYGSVEKLPVTEDYATRPISYYGITKYAAERFVHATGIRPDLKGKLHVTSFRMFNVYGPRQSLTNPYQGVMAIFIGNVLRKEPITLFGDGKQSRDFVFIEDVVNAWVGAINKKQTYDQVFNLGFGKDRSINELIETIIQTMKKDPKKYTIHHEKGRPGDQRHMRADIKKIYKAIGWQPKYNLQKGLEQTLIWARESQRK